MEFIIKYRTRNSIIVRTVISIVRTGVSIVRIGISIDRTGIREE